jgi:hypothetical protein
MHQRCPRVVICLLLLILPAISVSAQDKRGNGKEQPVIECRIIITKLALPNYPNEFGLLSFELKNVSQKPIIISYTRNPLLENLKGEVRTPEGKIVKYDYSHLSPMSATPKILGLDPGKSYVANYGAESLGAQGPGLYQIKVFFEFEKLKAQSPLTEVDLKATNK